MKKLCDKDLPENIRKGHDQVKKIEWENQKGVLRKYLFCHKLEFFKTIFAVVSE